MKKNISVSGCSWLLMLCFLFAGQLAVGQEKAAKIDGLLRQYAENHQFNGTVLVAEKGKVIFKKGYGLANMEWNIPNAPDTKFRLGSITKQFTAMAVMQQVQKGKLKLDGKITDYLPGYPKATGDKITIHHLLTHTSGIPSYTGFPDFMNKLSRDPFTPENFVKQFSDLPLEFEPGSTFKYNNSGYFLLGYILETVTGKSYATVLEENIFKPLQMKSTGYDLHNTILPKRATGYENKGGGYQTAPYLDMSIPYAAGSLYSTVEDLYLWDQALYSEKLLPNALKDILFKPFLKNYAYGWGVKNSKIGSLKDSLKVIDHGGGINGFNTLITRIPKDRQLVVLLNNTGGTNLSAMRDNIVYILYGQPVIPPKKSVALALRQNLSKLPLETALKQYQEIKVQPAFSLQENEMNMLGYELLGEGKLKEALAVFNLNVEAFPKSGNVYDSRGELYLKQGDKSLAIRDYKKAVELDPRNTAAIKILNDLGVETPTAKVIEVDTKILENYLGKYELAPSFVITVFKEGTHLYAQATGQPRFELFAESDTKFYVKEVKAQVSFVKNPQGLVDKMILFQNGQEIPGKRIN